VLYFLVDFSWCRI